jgi:hypothetical protein
VVAAAATHIDEATIVASQEREGPFIVDSTFLCATK